MYIAPSKAFAHIDRLADWKHGTHAAPVSVEWDLSNRCVLGCQDCHFAHTHVKGPWAAKGRVLPLAYDSTGDLADFGLVTHALDQMASAGVKGIVWSGGGEPTTHPLWTGIVAHAASLGLEQGMYTLGGLLTETSAKTLSEAATWVVVSLDCADADTYAIEKHVPQERFSAATRGIELLSKHGACVGVSFLLHKDNWVQASRMRELAVRLGATYTTFRPAIRTSPANPGVCHDDRAWITEAMPTLRWLAEDPAVEIDPDRFAEYRDWAGHGYDTCHGVKLTTVITPDGRMWPCPQRRGVGPALGDLREESFDDIWARHSGTVEVDRDCRVMCRLHLMNAQLVPVFAAQAHEAFV